MEGKKIAAQILKKAKTYGISLNDAEHQEALKYLEGVLQEFKKSILIENQKIIDNSIDNIINS